MNLKKLWYKNRSNAQKLYYQINMLVRKKYYVIDYFSLYMHKKLNYYLISIYDKFYNFSNGQLIRRRSRIVKFYKKSRKSFTYTINVLNKKLNKRFNSIEMFYIKNYNLKNYAWLKKYFTIIKPEINFMICTSSWNYVTIKKKRIKKKIYRNLLKKYKTK